QLDGELNGELARLRLDSQLDARGLAALAQKLGAARDALVQGESALDSLPPAVDKPYSAALGELKDKLAQVQDYLARREEFVKADRQLHEALVQAHGSKAQAQLDALLDNVAAYLREPTPETGSRLVNLIAQIKAGAGEVADAVRRVQLQQVADGAVAVLSARDQEQAGAAAVLALPTRSHLEQFKAAYTEYTRSELAATKRYRQVMVIYTVALLGAFGLIGFRLRQSMGALDRAYLKLQHTNANLEQTVEERTQDLRKALEDVRRQQAQLIQSEKMASLGQMVAGVAHEINTPLGYARSNVSIMRDSLAPLEELLGGYELALAYLQDPQADAQERERRIKDLEHLRAAWNPTDDLPALAALLADADHGLGQIAELVLGLKDFSRVDRSRTELFNVNDGLDTALKICHNQLKERIEIVREYGELPEIVCAPSQLNQVFLNIITNAGQAISGGGQIRIRTRLDGDMVEIGIRDSGSGMDAATQARIFEPFFTTKAVGQGTGLGLSIVYSIIQDHKGSIAVQSAPGQGTEFVIRLPRGAAAPKKIPAVEMAAA
ncbi:MAG TPA: ATP-binding protein, partial [Nevskiaceae bacterium]|nr:ATP-binding protein [Nevskiaceae bacterium]